jgi:hypothetical protein
MFKAWNIINTFSLYRHPEALKRDFVDATVWPHWTYILEEEREEG